MKNNKFYLNNKHCHGGSLRNHRKKRKARWLSNKKFHHLIFKVNRSVNPTSLRTTKTFRISMHVIKSYSKRFKVKISSLSVQHDHIHMIVKTTTKSQYQNYFRVVAGQIAQRVTDTFHCAKFKESFWKYRPFTRIIKDRRAFILTVAYVRLNELEVTGKLPYQKSRLRDLDRESWKLLRIDPSIIDWKFYPSDQDVFQCRSDAVTGTHRKKKWRR